MTLRPLVYVAGPYRRPDPVANTHRAIQVGQRLRALGAQVIIPHLSLLEHAVCPHPDDYWLEHTLDLCVRCDAIYRIAGGSEGSDAEVEAMHRLGRPVFYTDSQVADWVRSWEAQRA